MPRPHFYTEPQTLTLYIAERDGSEWYTDDNEYSMSRSDKLYRDTLATCQGILLRGRSQSRREMRTRLPLSLAVRAVAITRAAASSLDTATRE